MSDRIGVFGAGLAGCCTALALARHGIDVDLVDRAGDVMQGASLHNEGKLHLGYVYAADPRGLTHEVMAQGSLSFPGILEYLTDAPTPTLHRSAPFIYGVPLQSQLSVPDIAAHFERVDDTVRRVLTSGGPFVRGDGWVPFRQLDPADSAGRLSPDTLQAGFQTGEISLDTDQVAELLRSAVHAEGRIRLHLGRHVLSAAQAKGSGVNVFWLEDGRQVRRHYRLGVNCTWEDRLRLDSTLGILPARPWLMRYKAALTLWTRQPVPASVLPSVTLITGPFGDVVNHQTGKVYVSWYPLCKLAETRGMDGAALHAIAADRARGHPDLVQESVRALARFVPGLELAERNLVSVKVGGGVIFAWGQTDIDDPQSGLHERHAIGTAFNGDWASLDTGKYCMAPFHALSLAKTISGR